MTQQTAVEQLISEIERRVSIIQSEPPSMTRELMIENLDMALEKFKEMEKEQMQHWFGLGMQLVEGRLWKPIDKFEENFNETYGGN